MNVIIQIALKTTGRGEEYRKKKVVKFSPLFRIVGKILVVINVNLNTSMSET
jgi:hypothetical protein